MDVWRWYQEREDDFEVDEIIELLEEDFIGTGTLNGEDIELMLHNFKWFTSCFDENIDKILSEYNKSYTGFLDGLNDMMINTEARRLARIEIEATKTYRFLYPIYWIMTAITERIHNLASYIRRYTTERLEKLYNDAVERIAQPVIAETIAMITDDTIVVEDNLVGMVEEEEDL